jgi:hypothetical protein
MPRTSEEADLISPYAIAAPKLEPPEALTPEQAQCWREVMAGLPSDWVTSATAPLLVEYVRHITYARKVAEQLTQMRELPLLDAEGAETNRAIYFEFAQMARDESRIVADLAIKLRFCKQTRINSVTAERARNRLRTGPKPWEIIAGGVVDDDDDSGSTTN